MLGEELRPGLWAWSGYHREWKSAVSSYAVRTDAELVLIDPLLEEGQWPGLEQLAGGREVNVLMTTHWHARSAPEVAARLPGTRVWANSRARAATARRVEPTDVFRPGDELPGGLAAIAARPRTEVLFWDPAHRALFAGDALLGKGEGKGESDEGLSTCPGWWLPESSSLDDLRASLRPLLDLPVELLLVSHGESIEAGAPAELRRVLAP